MSGLGDLHEKMHAPARIDPITLEVVRSSLNQIVEQMAVTVQRTAYSVVIFEGIDFVCGVLDRDGNLLAGSLGVLTFLGNLSNAIKDVDSTIGLGNLEDGDIVFCNDPYVGGGTHGNDVTALSPIFHGGRLVGFTGFRGHTLDMGGMYAGGYYNNTTEIFQELLRVPPVKLYRRGELDKDLLRLILFNCRTPEYVGGDIRAMVSAVRVGMSRVEKLIEKLGLEKYLEYVSAMLDHADKLTREQLKKIPEGTYSAELILDGDGDDSLPLDKDVKVAIDVTVKGDHMIVDMSRSSDQSRGPLNSPRSTSISLIRYAFKSVTTPHLPINDGAFRALEVRLRKGSVVDPVPPAAASLFVEVTNSIPDLMLKALSSAVPQRVRAATFGSDVVEYTFGKHPKTGRLYVVAETSAPGGWGAKPFSDGETMFALVEGMGTYPMVEVFEAYYPILVKKFEYIPDSAGPGKYRGGLGVVRAFTPLGHDARVTVCFERQIKTLPWGLFGGKEATGNYAQIVRKDGRAEPIEKVTNYPLNDGDTIYFRTGGGGGYGDPLERDRQSVLSDVIDGYLSPKGAKDGYGVIIDENKNSIDEDATSRLRESMRQIKGP
jgi:N-methylhydantoinase B